MNLKARFYLTINFYRKLSFFAKEKASELLDSFLYHIRINSNSLNFKNRSASKRIVFVGLTPNHRVAKNLKWLKKTTSFELIILYCASTKANDLLPEYYHKKILFRNKTHLKRIFRKIRNVDLVYAYASKASYARVGIEMCNVPSIFDPYDCYVTYYGRSTKLEWLKKELIDEGFCFANATGVLARSMECYISYKLFNIPKTLNIFFSDYCDNDNFVINDLGRTSDEISIVYSGGIYGKHMQKSAHGFDDFTPLIESLDVQKIHFHIYPSPSNRKEVYYDFLETAKKLNYLHIHSTVKQEELSKELSKYHYGVLPHFKDPASKLLDYKMDGAVALKFFNFLEAGIPILVTKEMKFMAWLAERYKIGIAFSKNDIPNLRNIILQTDYEEMKRNVLSVRKKLSMAENAGRMITFFRSIAEIKK